MTVDESGAAFVYVTYALVGSIGFEPTTPTMSRWGFNQLSYEPLEARIIETPDAPHKPCGASMFMGECPSIRRVVHCSTRFSSSTPTQSARPAETPAASRART